MKIAINCCYGGFSISKECVELLKKKGINTSQYPCNEHFGIESEDYDAYRADKRLIEAITELGFANANGSLANIQIREIPDDVEWIIENYDGMESIHEQHRVW